ncbi:MAG TPA: Crp/Fnr family transcriptional regulator [Cyclobacteriaceae bacterium]|jgi:CRP/FNR family transcriptional regulator|nr:Crp/Fnr family transcriptional regulator [Cytophagales bacterium]HMR57783.1 Crp/Fnr family transcriptional regulator [Cyclobacteriaceae bacterium]HNT50227.1 Crp/Fnr family transcriptional regulator [Cyclobacteriaceae bacterium]HRE66129.1 Crp/Fnr family transcriptional regulator [Cyclobacteriaceae bacterium]HRF32180.1 Crp/Fnr family transcriptional regulator [Cyclobacteriaceae bacterium]
MFQSLLKEEVSQFGQLKKFPGGTEILQEDSYIKAIPLVLKGSLKVMRTDPQGHEILLYYITPGESCIMSFLGGIHNETSKVKAVVEEDAEILFIPVDKASEWVKKFPEWSDFIFRLYHKRFEELLTAVNAIAFQKLDSRLLQLLKQKSELYKSKEISITHQQLADELGTAREAVSRVIKQMENEGLVKLARNKITLL